MNRRPRFGSGNFIYHVLNRAVGRATIFSLEGDYLAFERVIEEARQQVPVRLLSYTIMPNHWHLILWPKEDGDLSEFMRWLTATHTQRWHTAHGTSGTGPLYQGRFKSFPVQGDEHFYTVTRYVERNALRANLVTRAEAWRWSSLWQVSQERTDVTLHHWPLERPETWIAFVNQPQTEAELAALRIAVRRGTPFGATQWQQRTAKRLGIESSLRPVGRPAARGQDSFSR